ncbi:MAG TPA: amidohydrolase family protein [Chitinophagales bacterium]|nr:amidohydrolase family protein [Chitinophagales bacterium]
MSKAIITGLIFYLATTFNLLNAQSPDVPTPAPAQKGRIYLTNATIHLGNGQVMENGTIGFENGKIVFLEKNINFKTDQTGKIIDCTGKHIYPGIIAMNTILGLSEIEAVRATNDYAETGAYNPDVRAIVAYNTDSRVTPTVRSNGVLYAQIMPQEGWVSGTSAVVNLDAWNWEDAAVKTADGVVMSWPTMFYFKGWWAEPQGIQPNKDYDKQVADLKEFLKEAKSYCEEPTHEKANLRFESMRGVFNKTENLYVRVDHIKEIEHAIAFAEELGVKIVLVGAKESYMIADELAQKKIPVILDKCHEVPMYEDEDVQQPYKTPAIMQKAGVLYCIGISEGFWQERNLMFEAGTAAAYGLTKEEALEAITLNPAKILGISDSIGTLEKGMVASLIVSGGDVLDMKTSNIEYAFIDGRQIDLNNKQKALYEKFAKKYGVY